MKAFRNRCAALGAAAFLIACAVSAQQPSEPSRESLDQIAAQDKALFDAVFVTCDLQALKGLLTGDFEFYHDKWGQIANSDQQFVDAIKTACERRKAGEDPPARRELVEGSVQIFPLNNYGAIQTGDHRFYQHPAGKPERMTEVARFTHLWKKVDGGWKLARVLSYDHRPVQEVGQ